MIGPFQHFLMTTFLEDKAKVYREPQNIIFGCFLLSVDSATGCQVKHHESFCGQKARETKPCHN